MIQGLIHGPKMDCEVGKHSYAALNLPAILESRHYLLGGESEESASPVAATERLMATESPRHEVHVNGYVHHLWQISVIPSRHEVVYIAFNSPKLAIKRNIKLLAPLEFRRN